MKINRVLFIVVFLFSGCVKNNLQNFENDNEKIYYISQSENTRNIYVLDVGTKDTSEFFIENTPDKMVVSLPVWFERGNVFLATFSNDINSDIYSFDENGKNLRNLSNTPLILEYNPVFSPDGNWIAFERFDSKSDIWLMDKNGKNLQNLTDKYPQNLSPVWSSDNQYIYFSSLKEGSPNIFRITISGELSNISKGVGVDGTFSLSTDSKKLVFDSDREGNIDLFLLDLETNDLVNLTSSSTKESEPLFSPDGEMILYKSHNEYEFDYFLYEISTHGIKNLTNLPQKYKGNAIWSRDSSQIYFSMREEGFLDIFSVNVITNEITNLTNTPNINEYTPLLVNFSIN